MRPRTSKHHATPAAARTTLLDLPYELRFQIYEEILPADKSIWVYPESTRWHVPAIAQTCNILRSEALAFFYGHNTFKVSLGGTWRGSGTLRLYKAPAINWLENIGALSSCLIRKLVLSLCINGSSYKKKEDEDNDELFVTLLAGSGIEEAGISFDLVAVAPTDMRIVDDLRSNLSKLRENRQYALALFADPAWASKKRVLLAETAALDLKIRVYTSMVKNYEQYCATIVARGGMWYRLRRLDFDDILRRHRELLQSCRDRLVGARLLRAQFGLYV